MSFYNPDDSDDDDDEMATEKFLRYIGETDEYPMPAEFFHRVDSTEVVYAVKKRKAKFLGKYIMGDLLGEGSYGKVKECIDTLTLNRRAVKILKKKRLRKIPNGEANVRREISIMKTINHENVIQFFDFFHIEKKQKMYIVIDYCVCCVQDMLENDVNKKFPLWQAHGYFAQILNGLEYLHGKGVVHKDIKPGNLLLNTSGFIVITDFGVAEQLDRFQPTDICTTSNGSPSFQPPEIANGDDTFAGFKVDIWSAGVTLYNFVSGTYPYDGDNIYNLYRNIVAGHYEIPEYLEPPLRVLIKALLEYVATNRPNIHEIRKFKWMTTKPDRNGPEVLVPPVKHNLYRSSTVFPYLQDLHNINPPEKNDQEVKSIDLNSETSEEKTVRRKPYSCLPS